MNCHSVTRAMLLHLTLFDYWLTATQGVSICARLPHKKNILLHFCEVSCGQMSSRKSTKAPLWGLLRLPSPGDPGLCSGDSQTPCVQEMGGVTSEMPKTNTITGSHRVCGRVQTPLPLSVLSDFLSSSSAPDSNNLGQQPQEKKIIKKMEV